VLLLLGRAFFKVLWFPSAYLMFRLRFFEIITARLHEPFQNISAFLGTELIQFIGIPAYRESVFIELPNNTLEVAEVCSGVNYLIAIIAIGIPLAYIALGTWQRRVLLVSASVLIAVLSNGLRVALIGILAYYNVTETLHGPGHVLQAMFTSAIGFIALFAGAWLLSGKPPQKGPLPGAASPADKSRAASSGPTAGWFRYFVTVAVLVAAGSYVFFYRPLPVPLKAHLAHLPYVIDGWKGYDIEERFGPFSSMEFDDHLSRTYVSPGGEEVNLHIGYFMAQAQGRELVNYMTEEMHVGAERSEVAIPGRDAIELNNVILDEGRRKDSVSFWYEINGRSTAGRYEAKIYTTWGSLLSGRSNGAFIVARSRNDGTGIGIEESFRTNEEFIKALVPKLDDQIPL
jgi:EpsI family protein